MEGSNNKDTPICSEMGVNGSHRRVVRSEGIDQSKVWKESHQPLQHPLLSTGLWMQLESLYPEERKDKARNRVRINRAVRRSDFLISLTASDWKRFGKVRNKFYKQNIIGIGPNPRENVGLWIKVLFFGAICNLRAVMSFPLSSLFTALIV